MGCDIHIFVEGRVILDGEIKWISLDKWTYMPNKYQVSFEPMIECDHIYDGRNYFLFSILADVRGDSQKKNPARGLPKNISKMVKKYYHYDGIYEHGCHDHSWLTLEELKDFKVDHLLKMENLDVNEYINQYKTLDPIIDAIEKKKIEVVWCKNLNDSDLRIVFWFDS